MDVDRADVNESPNLRVARGAQEIQRAVHIDASKFFERPTRSSRGLRPTRALHRRAVDDDIAAIHCAADRVHIGDIAVKNFRVL